MPDLPKTVIKLIAELLKHQAKMQLGEGFVKTLTDGLVDYAGEDVTEKINGFLGNSENSKNLLAAFEDADSAFAEKSDLFRQMIVSKPMRGLETLEKLAESLPKNLDGEGLQEALLNHFTADWSNISKEDLTHAASEYRLCLEHALAARCNQLLPTIFTKVERIEVNTKNILSVIESVKTTGEKILDRVNATSQKQEDHAISFEKTIPPMPSYYMERNEYTDTIKNLLLQDSKNVGITGVSHTVGLQGMGGIGKSIIANAIAHDEQIRSAFSDGVIWVTLGQNLSKDKIPEVQSQILKCFDESEGTPESPQKGLELLKNRFSGKKILLILDDVWDVKVFEYFDISFGESRLLVTTRHSQILTSIDAEECKIGVLSREQSLQLLRKQSKRVEGVALPELAEKIAKQCGDLPLALSMIGAMLKSKPANRWGEILENLKKADLERIKQKIKGYFHETLFAALHVSVEAQLPPYRNCYMQLAVFPEDTPIPESVLEFYWSEDDLQRKTYTKIIDELIDASLIFRYDDNSLMLHDLQRDYVYSQCGNIQALHQKTVDAYIKKYPDGWDSIPSEKPYYFQRYFGYHLQQSENKERAEKITEDLLNGRNTLNWNSILLCAEIIKKTPRQMAQQVIKTSLNSHVICNCIKILKSEAKEDARRLLKERQEKEVINACLSLLGSEAKEDARRLLKERQEKEVINACLSLLGSEAKEDARRLLKESKEKEVITACLTLLGNEAKEDARRLLKERHEYHIISVCLSLLREEAKEDARRLLKERHEPQIITVCLSLLGSESKEDARRLLKESKEPQVITVCLNLLGEEAKEDARRLLKESKNLFIQSACLNVLGSEANEDALEVLNNWVSKPRVLVAAALKIFADNPDKVEKYCRGILNNWERDIEFSIKKRIKKYSVHIVISLTHPKLKTNAKAAVSAMLKKEQQTPGFLDPFLLKIAQAISQGKTFVFGEEIDPQSL